MLRETDDPCCPECVPVMTPCGYKAIETKNLTVTSEGGSGNCTANVEMGVGGARGGFITCVLVLLRL